MQKRQGIDLFEDKASKNSIKLNYVTYHFVPLAAFVMTAMAIALDLEVDTMLDKGALNVLHASTLSSFAVHFFGACYSYHMHAKSHLRSEESG